MILVNEDLLYQRRTKVGLNPRDWFKRYELPISTPFFSSQDEQLSFFDELTKDLGLTKGYWSFSFTKVYIWRVDEESLVRFKESEPIIIKFSRKCDMVEIGLKWIK